MVVPRGLPTGVKSVLVSHESRSEVRRATLNHLATQHVHPLVHIDEGPAEAKQGRHVRQAAVIALASVPWERGVLFLEDDVRFRSDWDRILNLAVSVDVPTVLCSLELQTIPRPWCDWVRDAPRRVHRVKPRIVPMTRSVFYGVQCVYLPTWFLETIWSDPVTHDFSNDRRGMAFDSLLNWFMNQKPGQTSMSLSIPDMAQHLSPPSVRNPGRHKRMAHMFHWEVA